MRTHIILTMVWKLYGEWMMNIDKVFPKTLFFIQRKIKKWRQKSVKKLAKQHRICKRSTHMITTLHVIVTNLNHDGNFAGQTVLHYCSHSLIQNVTRSIYIFPFLRGTKYGRIRKYTLFL